MPQNTDLKGISFEFFDQNLEIWLHESNDSALPSALRMAKRESRNLQSRINEQGKLTLIYSDIKSRVVNIKNSAYLSYIV
jgi:hypothetical protein